jgi:protein-L-isoaspartate(D-aspartate) O-methyltransferase
MRDTYKHKGLRRQLTDRLRVRGIADEAVLAAIAAVPRHFFFDKTFEDHAYEDKAFPIGNDQTISQPYVVAYQTALLEIKKGDRVLEIGTGSGYQAAILATLGAEVFTIERQEGLFHRTHALLQQLGINSIRCFFRDGSAGLPGHAPFHKIIVTAAAPIVPDALRQQLAISGIMVIPVGDTAQYIRRIRRVSAANWQDEQLLPCRFVPFLSGVAAE